MKATSTIPVTVTMNVSGMVRAMRQFSEAFARIGRLLNPHRAQARRRWPWRERDIGTTWLWPTWIHGKTFIYDHESETAGRKARRASPSLPSSGSPEDPSSSSPPKSPDPDRPPISPSPSAESPRATTRPLSTSGVSARLFARGGKLSPYDLDVAGS